MALLPAWTGSKYAFRAVCVNARLASTHFGARSHCHPCGALTTLGKAHAAIREKAAILEDAETSDIERAQAKATIRECMPIVRAWLDEAEAKAA